MKDKKGKELPCEECGGRCCYYAPIEISVWEKVKHKAPPDAELKRVFEGTKGEAMVAMKPDSKGMCAFLSEGRCSIYSYRPMTCRAVGVRFPCAYVDREGAARSIAGIASKLKAKGHKFIYEEYEGKS